MENIEIKNKEKSTVEISGSITAEKFESYREGAFTLLGKEYEIDGFRKGAVPKAILEKKIPEMYILEEMAERAIGELYPQVLEKYSIKAIGAPAVKIKKIATNNPLEFSLETAVLPEIVLPEYIQIAETITPEKMEDVTEKEVDDTILEVQKMHGHNEAHGTEPHEHTEGEEIPIPELTDEFVQKLGDFKTVEDFKLKVKENLTLEKGGRAKSKTRAILLDKIISETKIEVPDMLVEYELDRFIENMKQDISRMGLTYEDYLKHLTKTEQEMRDSYRTDTEKKVKTEFILAEIAKKESIQPNEEKVQEQVEAIMKAYQGVDKTNAELYVKNMLQNDAVLEFLESKLK